MPDRVDATIDVVVGLVGQSFERDAPGQFDHVIIDGVDVVGFDPVVLIVQKNLRVAGVQAAVASGPLALIYGGINGSLPCRGEQHAVVPHGDVAIGNPGIAIGIRQDVGAGLVVGHVGVACPGERIVGKQIVTRAHVQNHVAEIEFVGGEVQRSNLSRDPRGAAADVVFDDSVGRLDRFATQQELIQGIGGHTPAGQGDVVRLAHAFIEFDRAEEGILSAERSAAKIVLDIPFHNTRIVIHHIRRIAHQDQLPGGIKDPHHHVGSGHTVGIVDVEDSRPL